MEEAFIIPAHTKLSGLGSISGRTDNPNPDSCESGKTTVVTMKYFMVTFVHTPTGSGSSDPYVH